MQVPFKLAKRVHWVWIGGTLSLVLVGGQVAAADNSAAPAPTADKATADKKAAADQADKAESEPESLGAVVVTAQRREQKAAEVPLALSVVKGSDLLKSAQIKQTNDVVDSVPNAHASQPRGPSRARWFIRGIGTNNTGNNTINPVGIYYVDVYIANISNQGWPLFDLSHVEVLNGPQGTLWGKNSNGGAINYVSQQPKFDKGGYFKVGFGSDNQREQQGGFGGTIVEDVVAGRVAFYNKNDDGWQKNILDGGKLGGGKDFATRAQLLVVPNENLDLTFNVHTRDASSQGQGAAYVLSTVSPRTVTTASQRANDSVYPGGANIITDRGETADGPTSPEVLEARGAHIKVNWNLGFAKLTSITAFESNRLSDSSFGNPIPAKSKYANVGLPYSQTALRSNSKQISEELRLTSPNNQALTWLAGLYTFSGSLDNSTVTANYIRGDTVGAGAATANAWGTGPQYTQNRYVQEAKNYAIFANFGYTISPKFKIGGGARWSHEENKIDWLYDGANVAGTAASYLKDLPIANVWDYPKRDLVYTEKQSQSSTAWTYDVTPEYIIDDNLRVYGRYAHGVLPGGYTGTGVVQVPGRAAGYRANQVFALKPEELNAIEAGLKSSWLNKRLNVDVTGFYYDYKNLVVNVPTFIDPVGNPGVSTVVFRNVGAAEIKGLEVRIESQPVKGLRLNGSLGFLRTKYTEDTGNTATILGAEAPRSPRQTANISASYQAWLPNGGSVVLGTDVNWRSSFYYYPTVESQITKPDPVLKSEAYAVSNLHLTWNVDSKERFSVQASILNATDTKYKVHSLPVTNGTSNQLYGRPRNYQISLNAKF